VVDDRPLVDVVIFKSGEITMRSHSLNLFFSFVAFALLVAGGVRYWYSRGRYMCLVRDLQEYVSGKF
jgi:hypothetical protein